MEVSSDPTAEAPIQCRRRIQVRGRALEAARRLGPETRPRGRGLASGRPTPLLVSPGLWTPRTIRLDTHGGTGDDAAGERQLRAVATQGPSPAQTAQHNTVSVLPRDAFGVASTWRCCQPCVVWGHPSLAGVQRGICDTLGWQLEALTHKARWHPAALVSRLVRVRVRTRPPHGVSQGASAVDLVERAMLLCE